MITEEQRQQASRPLKGMSFPFRINSKTGKVQTSESADKLKENIIHLLLTRIGERLMQREYGGGASQLLYENINDGLLEVAKHQIARALVRFEPRIVPQELTVMPGAEGELIIRISYIQAEIQGIQTLVIPIS